jgi:hypothetical protein
MVAAIFRFALDRPDSTRTPPLERHVPVELDELAAGLADLLPPDQREELARMARLLAALQAVELQERLDGLARLYRPFDPNRETAPAPGEDGSAAGRGAFLAEFAALLARANYVEVPRTELERALAEVSPRGLEVRVDLEELDALRVFRRGRKSRVDRVRDRSALWTRHREVRTEIYPRMLLAVALKEDPGHLHLRLFKDVARSDLEMFLPNTRVRMTVFDKVKLAVMGGGGTVGGLMATVTKLGAAASPTTWALGLAGIAGLLWRQVKNMFAHRTRYAARLSRCLWFHDLVNDLGAVTHLTQQAVWQESAEALLSYAVLAAAQPAGLLRAELDARAEAHLVTRHGIQADFEVDDGLHKLEVLGLLTEDAQGRLTVPGPREAFAALDALWDARFSPQT